jgi:hypothetical protein
MTKEDLIDIISDSIEETNRKHVVKKSTALLAYENKIKLERPNTDYMSEMIVEELVRKNIISVE